MLELNRVEPGYYVGHCGAWQITITSVNGDGFIGRANAKGLPKGHWIFSVNGHLQGSYPTKKACISRLEKMIRTDGSWKVVSV